MYIDICTYIRIYNLNMNVLGVDAVFSISTAKPGNGVEQLRDDRYLQISTCVYMYLYMYMNIYVYMRKYIHIWIYIYMYIYEMGWNS
jgi:hypothetical protein